MRRMSMLSNLGRTEIEAEFDDGLQKGRDGRGKEL